MILIAFRTAGGDLAYVESKRFFDARELARRLNPPDPEVSVLPEPRELPVPRWQVRWTGTRASRTPTRALEVRILLDPQQRGGWRPARLL